MARLWELELVALEDGQPRFQVWSASGRFRPLVWSAWAAAAILVVSGAFLLARSSVPAAFDYSRLPPPREANRSGDCIFRDPDDCHGQFGDVEMVPDQRGQLKPHLVPKVERLPPPPEPVR